MHRGTKIVLRSNSVGEDEKNDLIKWAIKQIKSGVIKGDSWLLRQTAGGAGNPVKYTICEIFDNDNPHHNRLEEMDALQQLTQEKIEKQEKFKATKYTRLRNYVVWTHGKCLSQKVCLNH